jgi:hypothetical protein
MFSQAKSEFSREPWDMRLMLWLAQKATLPLIYLLGTVVLLMAVARPLVERIFTLDARILGAFGVWDPPTGDIALMSPIPFVLGTIAFAGMTNYLSRLYVADKGNCLWLFAGFITFCCVGATSACILTRYLAW